MNRFSTFLGLAFGLALWLGIPSDAEASGRVHIGFNFGSSHTCAQRVWVPATYTTHTERVLVQDAHYVTQWVPPVYETRRGHRGRPYTVCVRKGYHKRILIPARYEMRTVRHHVPGYWRPVRTHRPLLGLFFGKDRHHDRHHGYHVNRGHDRHRGHSTHGHASHAKQHGHSGHSSKGRRF